ncbi:MAG: hypothetical protein LBP89_10340 [Helicobacteraceae bacterium]|jgi:hypothetical protein|nr:hypothetical protein [Helicobacteraceae bacterium]
MNCNTFAPIKALNDLWDNGIDLLFDKVLDGIEWVDRKAGGRIPLVLGKEVRELAGTDRVFKIARDNIFNDAAALRGNLARLGDDNKRDLTRALGGDIDPADLSDAIKPLYHRLRAAIDKNADDLIALGALNEKYRVQDYVKRYYEQYKERTSAARSYLLGKYFQRKDMTLDERLALGQIEDASFVVPQTILEQQLQIQKAAALKAFADRFSSDQPKDGFVRVPSDTVGGGVKKYGALAGRYIDERAFRYIKEASHLRAELNGIENAWLEVVDHLKVNLTIKNPGTHLYNVLSNLQLAFLHGDYAALGKLLVKATTDKAEFDDLVKLANRNGINTYLNELDPRSIDIDPQTAQPSLWKSFLKNVYMTKGSATGEFARRIYDWEDKFFKVARFGDKIDEAKERLGRELTNEEIRDIALEANDAYVDYDKPMTPFARAIDKNGIFPFLNYTYKSTPMVARMIFKHPLRFAVLQFGLSAIGGSMLFNDDDDLARPDWAGDKWNLFGAKNYIPIGNGAYLNLGRALPGLKFAAPEFGGFVTGISHIASGQSTRGYDLSGKYDDAIDRATNIMLEASRNYLPSMTLGRYAQGAVKIAAGAELKENEPKSMGWLAARALGIREFNPAREIQRNLNSAKNKLREDEEDYKNDRTRLLAARAEYAAKIKKIEEHAAAAGVKMDANGRAIGGSAKKESDESFSAATKKPVVFKRFNPLKD